MIQFYTDAAPDGKTLLFPKCYVDLAVNLAESLQVNPMAFVLAVIFAASCSFATPIAYQTNLLVMTPGNFRFSDFMRAGIPLVIILWLTYSAFAPWYFGL